MNSNKKSSVEWLFEQLTTILCNGEIDPIKKSIILFKLQIAQDTHRREMFTSGMIHTSQISHERISVNIKKLKNSKYADKIYTFDEFVEYGRLNGGNIVNGMPWSFEFNGYSVSHENDDMYIICGATYPSIKFHRSEIIQVKGEELIIFRKDINLPS